jgi:hypothetical protein
MLYLDFSCLNLSLGIFLEFCDFLSIFSALNELLEFLWNSFVLKMYFRKKKKKKKTILPVWAEPVGSTRLHPLRTPALRPARPTKPIWPTRPWPTWPGRRRHRPGRARPRPYKGQRRATRPCPRSPPSLRRSGAGRRKPAPLPCPSRRARQPPALTSDFRPPPFVSVAGEHTFAIALISSLHFASHPSP